MKIKFDVNQSKLTKYNVFTLLTLIFWYLAFFPGILNNDNSQLIRLIRKGELTDYWTSTFCYFVKFTTFNGKFLGLSSLICLLIFAFSISWLISSLKLSKPISDKTILLIYLTPLFGAFGVNISHDVLKASGILLLIGIQFRKLNFIVISNRLFFAIEILASFLLLTANDGIVIIFCNLVILFFQKFYKLVTVITILCAFIIVATSNGMTIKTPKSTILVSGIIDIKCIAQHPEAEISSSSWRYLETIAPKDEWLNPVTCSDWAPSLEALKSLHFSAVTDLENSTFKISPEFFKVYFSVIGRNPAIAAMSHIQRSVVALPPPFFQVPQNQVILNSTIPVGEGTNTALQTGPGVLHPSIDEPSVYFSIGVLKPLNILAQGLTFLFNQASWFWGWGGFWLWPIIIFTIKRFRIVSIPKILYLYFPTAVLHIVLIIIGTGSHPRYVMSTTILGVIVTSIMLFEYLEKIHGDNLEKL